MSLNIKEEIIETLSKMSIIELNELIKMIENKFSISSYSDLNNNINNINNNNKIETKELFNIKLINPGNNKISVIKFVRSILNLGLKESKELVDSCPVILKNNLIKEDVENIKKTLEECGAIIEIE
ncbi:50S ribosomal protein L7/L12 [Candidatus Nardonella dryophthoridicola]|uniref:Large ribosomal subunit protein bL12 n=1 Tax=endosymbiont of Metamasius hemipterus TaxID=204627 RepID=A0ABT0TW62_9GAMM|nr:50S ribosomal protein L7/L12 [Candidatus Nardonella dryophthoridicola]MCM0158230.1 50S ribosomal protein L7/L12 [endosymbiont of Metamasius hemipterus]